MTAMPGLGTPRPASPDLLRSVFRRHAAGVAVITASGARGPVGFTATSLTSVSAEPPVVSFGIGTGASSWPAISEAGHVGVHVLGEHQRELAATFARSGADRFGAPTRWRKGPEEVPVLDDVLAWLVCRVVARVRRATTASSWRRSCWAITRARAAPPVPPGPVQRPARLNPQAGAAGLLLAGSTRWLHSVAKVTVQSACLVCAQWVYW